MKTIWMEIETMELTGRGAKTIAKLLDQANRADDRMRRLSDPTLALWAGQSADRKRKRAENMFARYCAQPRARS